MYSQTTQLNTHKHTFAHTYMYNVQVHVHTCTCVYTNEQAAARRTCYRYTYDVIDLYLQVVVEADLGADAQVVEHLEAGQILDRAQQRRLGGA